MHGPFLSEFEARRVGRMLGSLFLGRLRPGEAFAVRGHLEPGWVGVAVELGRADGSFAYAVEARVARKSGGLGDNALKEVLYDLHGALWDGYLGGADREPFTGPKWEEVDYAGHRVWLRGQERDPRSEAAADAMIDAGARTDAARARATAAADDDPSAP